MAEIAAESGGETVDPKPSQLPLLPDGLLGFWLFLGTQVIALSVIVGAYLVLLYENIGRVNMAGAAAHVIGSVAVGGCGVLAWGCWRAGRRPPWALAAAAVLGIAFVAIAARLGWDGGLNPLPHAVEAARLVTAGFAAFHAVAACVASLVAVTRPPGTGHRVAAAWMGFAALAWLPASLVWLVR